MELQSALKKLLIREPFYGIFVLGLNKKYTTEIDTAAVCRNGINSELLVNKEWFESQNDEICVGTIQHELMHLLFQHVVLDDYYENHELLNIACDLEVNSYIPALQHEPFIYPAMFNMPERMGVKWYYENAIEYAKKAGYDLKAFIELQSIKNHKFWKDFADLSDAEKELVKQQINSQAKHSAEQVMKQAGSIPDCFKEYINGLFKDREAIFNWKSYFRRVIGNSIESFIKSTRYRPSKRFKGNPGNTLKFKPKVLVAVDTSGSVSNNELSDFFTEIDHLHKSGITVDILEFDTRITNKFTYKNRNQKIEICGRGGTDVSEAWNYYSNHPEYSTFVIFTDGYLNYNLPHRKNVIWIISSSGQKAEYPGITIYIPKWN